MDSYLNEKVNSYESILGDLEQKILNYKQILNFYPNKDNTKIIRFEQLKNKIKEENKSFFDLISKYQLDNSNLQYENFYLKRQNKFLEDELQKMNEKYNNFKNKIEEFNKKLKNQKRKKNNKIELIKKEINDKINLIDEKIINI